MIRGRDLPRLSLAKIRLPVIPRLLVSVRDTAEARCVLQSGADILDVKEPTNGPLGMASIETISEIARSVTEWNRQTVSRQTAGRVNRDGKTVEFKPGELKPGERKTGGRPVVEFSVALGEVADWLPSATSLKSSRAAVGATVGTLLSNGSAAAKSPIDSCPPSPAVPVSASDADQVRPFLKLGPGHLNTTAWQVAGMMVDGMTAGGQKQGSAAFASGALGTGMDADSQMWPAAINYARQQVTARFGQMLNVGTAESSGADSVKPAAMSSRCWIAVCYADAALCGAPDLLSMARHAVHDPFCAGLLIDTCIKDGRGLLSWVTPQELAVVRQMTAASGLLLALAGQITIDYLPGLVPVQPDVIGVRGVVCGTGDRQNAIQASRIQSFRQAVSLAFHHD